MRRHPETWKKGPKFKKRKIQGNVGKKQASLSSSNCMQWEATSQKPEGQSRCVPSKENSRIGKKAGWLDQNRFVNLTNTDTPSHNIFFFFFPKSWEAGAVEDELCPLSATALVLRVGASDWQGRGQGELVSGGLE